MKLGTVTRSRENVIVEIDGRPAGEVYIEKLEEVTDYVKACPDEYVYKKLPPLGVVRVLPPVGYRIVPRTPLEVTDDYIRTAGYVVEGEQLLLLGFDDKPNAPVKAYQGSLSSGEEPLASILVTCAGRKPLKEIPDKHCVGMYSSERSLRSPGITNSTTTYLHALRSSENRCSNDPSTKVITYRLRERSGASA